MSIVSDILADPSILDKCKKGINLTNSKKRLKEKKSLIRKSCSSARLFRRQVLEYDEDLCKKMNESWIEMIRLKKIEQNTIHKIELCGAFATVVSSDSAGDIGIHGIIVAESNSFIKVFETATKKVKSIKKQATIIEISPGNDVLLIDLTAYGNPVNRFKKGPRNYVYF